MVTLASHATLPFFSKALLLLACAYFCQAVSSSSSLVAYEPQQTLSPIPSVTSIGGRRKKHPVRLSLLVALGRCDAVDSSGIGRLLRVFPSSEPCVQDFQVHGSQHDSVHFRIIQDLEPLFQSFDQPYDRTPYGLRLLSPPWGALLRGAIASALSSMQL